MGYAGMVIARARRYRGETATARDILKRSVVLLENGYGPRHPRTLEARALLDTLSQTTARRPGPSALTNRPM